MLITNKRDGYSADGRRLYFFGGGGGGGGPTQTTSTVQNTNIPDYAKGYVENMLGATQEQLFTGTRGPDVTNPETGEVTRGMFNITGFKPYQAYGGTYDQQGNQTSYDPTKAVAGFSPSQIQAQQGIMGMQSPYHYNQAAKFTADLGQKMADQTYTPGYTPGYTASDFQKYQMNGVDDVTTSKFDQAAADQYMNPYMQNVVDIQKREANRSAQQMASQNAAKFAGAGAFGGSRQAVAMAEADRNLSQQMGDIQSIGSNQAYQQAMQQFNADQGRSLAAAQGNQSKNLSMGQANLQALLSTQAQQEQARQFQEQTRQFQEQANQFGANYGLQSQQAALGASRDYANFGQMGLNAQKDIYGMQNQVGAQQQQLEQARINQSMLDYANAQQYPLMQLGTMSNMLRGLPMQASTTNQYAASPSPMSQAVGTIGAGASIYNAMRPGGAAGGLPSEFKYSKGGGIMSYDMGGEVEEQLESMDEKGLQAQARESSSPSIRRMAQRILRERQMGEQNKNPGAAGVQYQAAQPQMPAMRGGGIIAFAQGKTVYGGPSSEAKEGEEEARGIDQSGKTMDQRLAMPPTTGGIMGATAQPATPVPVAPQVNRALQQSPDIPAFMKAEYAEAERRKNAPLSEFMAERRAAMQEAGVADVSEGQQKQRAELMAEKANMADEKERQKHLRLAEFFASWGSTPGPTLVAGMNALKQAVPGIVSDEKEQKKARREIDKSIADLDNATRLEKRGEVDAAMALKLKAAEDMKALNIKFIDYQSRRESDQSSAAASKYSADMQFRSEQLRSQTSALDRAARRDTDKDNKIFGQWQAAAKTEGDILGRIQREENDKQHMADLNAVKLGKQTGTDEDNKFDETKVPPAVLSAMKEAQARIETREKNWKQRIKTAAENTDLAYNRIAIRPEVATRDYTRPTGEPQAGASTRPPLTDPSLQRQ
jgi:soluble cytochrome b562